MYKIFVIIIIIGFSGSAFAEIYSWTDEKGVKHYSTVAPSDDAANVIRSDEIEYDAEKDKAGMLEYEKWINRKGRERKIGSLKIKKRTKSLISDENQYVKANGDGYKKQKKSARQVIIYVKQNQHVNGLKAEKNIKARKARVKPEKAPIAKSSEKDKLKISKKR